MYNEEAYWLYVWNFDEPAYHICSNCRASAVRDSLGEWCSPYCPHCGAEMIHIETEQEYLKKLMEDEEPEIITYGDVFEDFKKHYPETYNKNFHDYRPAEGNNRIRIWLKGGDRFIYDYSTKLLRVDCQEGE